MLELADPGAEALWFEGRRWSYSELILATFYAAAYDAGPRPSRLLKDVGTLIFTSGTSGKPKAVAVKNFLLVVVSTPLIVDAKNVARYLPLRTFSCLPLFHTTCLFTGLYYSTGLSGSFYLARKFSASRFTAQLVESGATRMLHVGELCRYLVARPPSSFDQAHRCIVTLGNVYRSTEGITKFDNFTYRKAGAGMISFAGPVKLYSEKDFFLAKYDPSTQSLYRDLEAGFCVLAKAREPGEAIGRVRSMDFYNKYYNDPAATQLKLVSSVFEKGGLFQRTGDMLMHQKSGWIRFMLGLEILSSGTERTSVSARFKTTSASFQACRTVLSMLSNSQHKVPTYDGQAGAAAITLADPQAKTEFAQQLYPSLHSSGLAFIETTATFTQPKAILQSLPCSPDIDNQQYSLFWLNGEQYRRIDTDSWAQIELGKARL
ncbi:hypothetical protein B0J15DRAFT_547446 [Fusarium solani]|uniref:AMP-dependent synthetase/ligase domain-containing protein n=1 Tax=Fusarium solani TaxID=169388 RepID=A0A9P9HMI0_FUSSL|nr:uncharacterized protein B0J15DRAFT_547446 [Fusarium solani]KAH7259802.1 hypothetical protein B0J15DRAFT_547446 [Fusarium solani]